MKKKLICLLLAVLTLVPMLAACSEKHYEYDSYQDFILLGAGDSFTINQTALDNAVLSAYYDYYSDEIEAKTLTSTELTSGTVKFGDTVNIDYKGFLFGETETFEGGSTYDENGTAKGTDLEIGSGSYIEGFETGLIGYEVGDTVYLNLYFPEDYGNEDLNGKQVRFEVKINKISTRYDYPEMTDEVIKTQSSGSYNTIEEFKAQVIENTKKNEVWSDFYAQCKVKEYPEDELNDYYYNTLDTHKQYATAWYGGNMTSYASAMGYSDVATFYSYLASQAASQVKQDLMVLATVEKFQLELSETELEKEFKAIYNEQVEAESFDGSFKKFKKTYGQKALEIEVYTDVIVEFLLEKLSVEDDTKFTGIKASYKTGIKYYKDDAQQFGWVKFDIDKDGTDDTFYFDTESGLAYEDRAAYVPTEADASVKKYYKFGRFGMLENIVDKTVESDGTGLIYAIDGVPQTGFQTIERDGRIDGAEIYYFDETTHYMWFGAHELEDNADIVGVNAGKYYNFGDTGIFNLDKDGNTLNDLSNIDASNGIADGLVGDQYFEAGALYTGRKTIDDNDHYFDPDNDGKMVVSDFFTVDEDKFYADKNGYILKSTSQTIGTTVYTFDETGKITAEVPANSEE